MNRQRRHGMKTHCLGSELRASHVICYLRTRPYRPRTNGKVERFHQTMNREWVYGVTEEDDDGLVKDPRPYWLQHYNTGRLRQFTSEAGHPKAGVHNLHGHVVLLI